MVELLMNPKTIWTIIDILLVIVVLNRLFMAIKGTKGIFFFNGIIILYLANIASVSLNLKYLSILLNWFMMMLTVAIPIIFQNELKRALEILGRRNPIVKWFVKTPVIAEESIDIVSEAVETLSKQRIGALIVLVREDPLTAVSESGSHLDCVLNKILFEQIFYPNTPLHDGAILIKGSRILAAGCFLPLDNQLPLPQELGSRHRAGLTLSSQSDAIVVIVSEETGGISLAYHGILEKGFNDERLKYKLKEMIAPVETRPGTSIVKTSESNEGI